MPGSALRRCSGLLLALLWGIAACGDRSPAPATDRVASYRGGEVSRREAEHSLRPTASAASAGPESLLAAYREAAESVVLDRLLVGDLDTAEILAALGEEGRSLQRRELVSAYLAPRLADLGVGPGEVEAFYAAHRTAFRRDAQRNLSHLFRRHRDPARPEATLSLLRDLKRRAEAGEGFAQLAREYSDSETRVLGGRLGLIGAGRLPKALEKLVFALPAGAVSEPLEVPGGAALFFVSDVIEARDFPLEDVRGLIASHLLAGKRRARIVEMLAGHEPPPGSTVLAPDRLLEVVAGAEDDVVVLAIGGNRLTAGELRSRLVGNPGLETPMLEPTPREQLLQAYDDEKNEQLLFLAASSAGTPSPQRQASDERLRRLAREALLRQRMEERMRQRVKGDEPALRRFHADNRHLYQTGLRLKLQSLTVPAATDAPQVLEALEAARGELTLGALDLAAIAARLGGRVADLGWIDFDTLMTYEPKVRYYVLELNGTGYTVPFQLNQQLCLIRVEAREEPRQLAFEEVRERVASDYLDRHRSQLHRTTRDDLLREAGFRYHEDAVRRALAPPSSAPAPND